MSFGKFEKKEISDIISCSWSPYWLRPGGPEGAVQFNSASVFSGSSNFIYDYSQSILSLEGDLIVHGNITAEQYILSSSILYYTTSYFSGSTKFGDTSDDTHQYTGSIYLSGSIYFDTNAHNITTTGQLAWNTDDWTLEVGLSGSNVPTLRIGEQQIARVYNDNGTSVTKGQVVYISGSQGNRIAVKLASAAVENGSANTLGLVYSDTIPNGSEGYIITEGPIFKLNTIGLSAGLPIYLSTTAGAYTQTSPNAPDHRVILGFVERVHASVGSIYVKVDNGYELNELHNVLISTPSSSGDLLVLSGSVWINSHQLTGSYGLTGSLSVLNGGITGSLYGTSSWAYSSSVAISASYAFSSSYSISSSYSFSSSFAVSSSRAVTSSYAISSSYSLYAVSSSYTLTASYVNPLYQNVIITGSLSVGLLTTGSGENTLVLGMPPAGGAGEGGQILLSAPGGTYTSASMWDNYQNLTRLLRGTNTASDAVVASFNMHSKQAQLPAYNSTTAFNGTSLVGLLGFDNNGNILTTTTAGGGGTAISFYSGSTLLTSNLTSLRITGSGVSSSVNASSGVTMSFTGGGGGSSITVINGNTNTTLTTGLTTLYITGSGLQTNAPGGGVVTMSFSSGSGGGGSAITVIEDGTTLTTNLTQLTFNGSFTGGSTGTQATITYYEPYELASNSGYLDTGMVLDYLYYGKAIEGWNGTRWDSYSANPYNSIPAIDLAGGKGDYNCGVIVPYDLTDQYYIELSGIACSSNPWSAPSKALRVGMGYLLCDDINTGTSAVNMLASASFATTDATQNVVCGWAIGSNWPTTTLKNTAYIFVGIGTGDDPGAAVLFSYSLKVIKKV